MFVVLFKISKEHIWIGIRNFVFPINIFSERQNEILVLITIVYFSSLPFLLKKVPLRLNLVIISAPILYILFRAIYHIRQYTVGAPGSTETLSLLFVIVTIICVIISVRWIFTISDDPIRLIAQIVFIVNSAYLFFVSLQFVFAAGPLYNGPRFYGLANHPNQFAATLALMNTAALYFLIRSYLFPSKSVLSKLLPIALILGNFGFILISGSRTGIVTIIIATFPFITSLFFRKPFATLVVFMFVSTLVIGVFFFVSTTNFDVYRIFSTVNTRDYIFSELWSGFLEYPLIGVPYVDTHTSNSYLMALANVGIIGGLPFFAFLAVDLIYTIRLNLMNNSSMRGKLETSFLTSTFLGVFALGFLDGFLLQVISFSQLFAIMFVVARCCYIEFWVLRSTKPKQLVGNYNQQRHIAYPNRTMIPHQNI